MSITKLRCEENGGITYRHGSIFLSNMQTLVNPVNTVGVMGKGLAKQFANRYPRMAREYKEECRNGNMQVGVPWLYRNNYLRWTLNFPTKKHWAYHSKPEYIELGLYNFVEKYEFHGITGIAFPKLGCGLGGLDWPDVQGLFEKYLGSIDIPVEIYILNAK